VRDLPQHVPLYDWLFLLIGGVGLIAAGLAMVRSGRGVPAYPQERRSGGDRRLSYP
jgi:hypothetical protein